VSLTLWNGSRDSVEGIATHYGLEGPGIESRWGEIFRTCPDQLRGPPSLLYNGYWLFPWGKGGRGVMLTTHPLLVPRLRKSWTIPPLTLWVLLGLLRGFPLPFTLWNVWISIHDTSFQSFLSLPGPSGPVKGFPFTFYSMKCVNFNSWYKFSVFSLSSRCKQCSRAFKKSYHLKEHARSHVGKNLSCTLCERKCTTFGALRVRKWNCGM
jgi:hypothetical protein